MRYPQELVDVDEYRLPAGQLSKFRISAKEMDMAETLIESMSAEWNADDYKDEFRTKLQKVIEKRLKTKGAVTPVVEDESATDEHAATNVVDFMALLQQSLKSKRRTPPKKATTKQRTTNKRAPSKKTARKRSASR
jgi:DNA end-binding protein Ku